jgi:hypothetical protein
MINKGTLCSSVTSLVNSLQKIIKNFIYFYRLYIDDPKSARCYRNARVWRGGWDLTATHDGSISKYSTSSIMPDFRKRPIKPAQSWIYDSLFQTFHQSLAVHCVKELRECLYPTAKLTGQVMMILSILNRSIVAAAIRSKPVGCV